MIENELLKLMLYYNQREYDDTTISKFIDNYRKNLDDIIDHCINKDESELTASDFSTQSVDQEDVEKIYDILKDI